MLQTTILYAWHLYNNEIYVMPIRAIDQYKKYLFKLYIRTFFLIVSFYWSYFQWFLLLLQFGKVLMSQSIDQKQPKKSYKTFLNKKNESVQHKVKSLKHIKAIVDNSNQIFNLPSITKNHKQKSELSSQKAHIEQLPRTKTDNPQSNHNFIRHTQPFVLIQKRSPQQIENQQIKRRRRKEFAQIFKPSNTKKIECLIQAQIRQDKQKYPNKYQVLSRQLGLTDRQIFEIKDEDLKYQLQKYTKSMGLKYLRQNKQQNRHSIKRKIKTEEQQESKNEEKKQNYCHSISGKEKKRRVQLSMDDKKKAILKELQNRQETLGKMILVKVKNHLQAQKKAKNYFCTVQSQENIDDTLIEFLKTKINRAEQQFK